MSPLNCWKHLWRFIRGVNRLILKLESVHSIIPTCVYHLSLQYDFNSTSRTPENKNKTLKSLKKETKTQNTNTKSPEHEHEDLKTRTRRPQNTNTKTLEHEREDPKTRKPRLNTAKWMLQKLSSESIIETCFDSAVFSCLWNTDVENVAWVLFFRDECLLIGRGRLYISNKFFDSERRNWRLTMARKW